MVIDILFGMIALTGFWMGFKEGIVNTIFSVLSIIIALMVAFKFSPAVTKVLEDGFEIYNPLMFVVGLVLTFFFTMWGLRMVGGLVTQVMEATSINLPNQILGAGLLSFFFIFLYSILIWFVDSAQLIAPQTRTESHTYVILDPIRRSTFSFLGGLKPTFTKFFQETNRAIDSLKEGERTKDGQKTDIYDIEEPTEPPK